MTFLTYIFIFQLFLFFIPLETQSSSSSGGCINLRDLFRKKLNGRKYKPGQKSQTERKREEVDPVSFRIKRDDLMTKLGYQLKSSKGIPFELQAHRSNIFEESYTKLINAPISTLRTCNKLEIQFTDEMARGRGVRKEYFTLLSKSAVNPDFGLFKYTSENNMLEINPLSGARQTNHLSYFRFIGRVAALAVKHDFLLDANLPLSFFKSMLDKPVVLKDMEEVDPEYYRSLSYIKENNPRDLHLTFSVLDDTYKCYELKPGGKNISVTQENKMEYINLIIQGRLVTQVKEQMTSFKTGFNEIIEQNLIQPFNELELRILLFGTEVIDIEDWKTYTKYYHYTENSPTVILFWQVVSSFTDGERRKLLHFVTGSQRLPVDGFRGLSFTICCKSDCNAYPKSSVCTNSLWLPRYTSYQMMKERLSMALKHMDGMHRS